MLAQGVIFSEGNLFLDNCDFSGRPSSVLVQAEENSTVVIRNAVLGDQNCERAAEAVGSQRFFVFSDMLLQR